MKKETLEEKDMSEIKLDGLGGPITGLWTWVDEQVRQEGEAHDIGLQRIGLPPSPLNSQVGGDHYKNQGLQPFEITYANFGYKGLQASVYTKVNKYLTRDKGDHRENVEKAIHCLQIQLQFWEKTTT